MQQHLSRLSTTIKSCFLKIIIQSFQRRFSSLSVTSFYFRGIYIVCMYYILKKVKLRIKSSLAYLFRCDVSILIPTSIGRADPMVVEQARWLALDDGKVGIFIHSFIHSLIHFLIDRSIDSNIQTFIHSFIHWFIYSLIHSSIDSFIHSFIRSFTYSFIHSFIHLSIYSCIRLFKIFMG